MKKTYISLLALLLITSLLCSACVFVKNEEDPTSPSTSSSPTLNAAGSDDDFTTDLDIFTDLIPSEPDTSEGLDVIATSEATEPDNEGTTPSGTTEATEPETTEPTVTENKPEPVVPSPTNSNGEIELPMIPG